MHGEQAESRGGAPENSRGSPNAGAEGERRPTREHEGAAHHGWWRALITLVVLGAVWWPARPGGSDGFPLSSYPMFGYARPSTSTVDTVLGVDAEGNRRALSPALLAGVSQPKLALERVRAAIRGKRAAELCRDVALRVEERPVEELRVEERPVALEVVTETWDTLEGLEPGTEPRERVVHARCDVDR